MITHIVAGDRDRRPRRHKTKYSLIALKWENVRSFVTFETALKYDWLPLTVRGRGFQNKIKNQL